MFHCCMNALFFLGGGGRARGGGGGGGVVILGGVLFSLSVKAPVGSNPFGGEDNGGICWSFPDCPELGTSFGPGTRFPDCFFFPFLRLIVSTTEPSLSFSACLTGLIFPVPASFQSWLFSLGACVTHLDPL